jgi:hypothetical protein
MHPMYSEIKGDSLKQGDIIDRIKLLPSLKGHADYFAWRDDFVAFCVITQSCDVARDRHVDFIQLAVIRDLVVVYSSPDAIAVKSKRAPAFFRDILGQEYNKRGFFCLHAEPSIGINENCVVDLRTMLSLHRQHYDEILAARKLSMIDAVANKLGWMAGQLFSRVPTPEWDSSNAKFDLEKEIDSLLDRIRNAKKRSPLEVVMPVMPPEEFTRSLLSEDRTVEEQS